MKDRVVIVDILTKKFKSICYKQYDENNELNIDGNEYVTETELQNQISPVNLQLEHIANSFSVTINLINEGFKFDGSDESSKFQSLLDRYLGKNVTVDFPTGKNLNISNIEFTGTLYLRGNECTIRATSGVVFSNKDDLGLQLIVENLNFFGSAQAIKLVLVDSTNKGLKLNIRSCSFNGEDRTSTCIECSQIDFLNIEDIYLVNYDVGINIHSDWGKGQRDNTQMHMKNHNIMQVNTAYKFRQLDKASFIGLDISRCNIGFEINRDCKRITFINCHAERFGEYAEGYGFKFTSHTCKEIRLQECSAFLPSEYAKYGLYIPICDSASSNRINITIDNCSFDISSKYPSYKSMLLNGRFTYIGNFPFSSSNIGLYGTGNSYYGGRIISQRGYSDNLLSKDTILSLSDFNSVAGTDVNCELIRTGQVSKITNNGSNDATYSLDVDLKKGWYTILYKGNMETTNCRLLFEQRVSPWKRYFNNMIIETEDPDCQINRIFFYITEDTLLGRIRFMISPSESINITKIGIYKGIRNDLSDKPAIPSVDGLATKKELTDGLATKSDMGHTHDQYLTEHQDLSDYALKTELPSVPTKTSQLTNDSGFITSVPSEYVTETELEDKGYLTEHQNISGKADKSEIPTKTSQLTNDSGYLTSIPSEYITEEELNAKGLATETFVTNKIAEASLSSGEVDLSGYATKDELNAKANKSDIPNLDGYALKTEIPTVPTKLSQLQNDSNFISSIPEEYITETELNAKGYLTSVPLEYVTEEELESKGYLTEHQDISDKADKSEIPTKTSQLTNDSGFITEHQNISGKADKSYVDTELAKKSDKTHAHSYNDLSDKPAIPSVDGLATKKELTDGLATKSDTGHAHDQYLTEHQDLSDYALKSEIPTVPTKTSQLTNDSNFISSIPEEYVTEQELNSKGLATETFVTNKIAEASLSGGEVDLSGYATKDELNSTIQDYTGGKKQVYLTQAEYDMLIDVDKNDSSKVYNITDAVEQEIPTKTSQLTNDSGFITEVPSEYVTETELNAKGYLTEHQDISNKADRSEIPIRTSQLTNDSNFISSIPSEYITEEELNAKGLATETFVTNKIAEASLSGGEVDLSGYATKDELNSTIQDYTGGKKQVYLTQAEYDILSDVDKNDSTKVYNITDATEQVIPTDLTINDNNLLQLKDANGNAIGTGVTLSSNVSGSFITDEEVRSTLVSVFGEKYVQE